MDDLTVVFTTDDAGSNRVDLFQELLGFLQRRQVRGMLFTILAAQGQPLDERPDWVDALRPAQSADYERAARTSGLFVVMTHFYAMTGKHRRGLDLYDRLFDYMEARGTVQYRTVAEAALLPRGPWPV